MMETVFAIPSAHSARHAALLLHAMEGSDREWLMARLPAEERYELQTLVQELNSLGIAPDPELLTAELDRTRREPSLTEAQLDGSSTADLRVEESDAEFLLRLDDHDVRSLVEGWRDEPPLLIARCLNLRSWPWFDQALRLLAPLRKRDVEIALSMLAPSHASGHCLANALMTAMRAQCEAGRLRSVERGTKTVSTAKPSCSLARRAVALFRGAK